MKKHILFWITALMTCNLVFAQQAQQTQASPLSIEMTYNGYSHTLSVTDEKTTIDVVAGAQLKVSGGGELTGDTKGKYFASKQDGETLIIKVTNTPTPAKKNGKIKLKYGDREIALVSKSPKDFAPLNVKLDEKDVAARDMIEVYGSGCLTFKYNPDYADLFMNGKECAEDIVKVTDSTGFDYRVFGQTVHTFQVRCLDKEDMENKILEAKDTPEIVKKYIAMCKDSEAGLNNQINEINTVRESLDKELKRYKVLFSQSEDIFKAKFDFDVPPQFQELRILIKDVQKLEAEMSPLKTKIDDFNNTAKGLNFDTQEINSRIYKNFSSKIYELNNLRRSISKRKGILSQEQCGYIDKLSKDFKNDFAKYVE